MAKKKRSRQTRQDDKSAMASSLGGGEASTEVSPADALLDAVAEIVHQGFGYMLDAGEVRAVLDGWKPNCSMNFEYVFSWKPSIDPSALAINWKRPQLRILRHVVKDSIREASILNGSPMTKVEQQAYRLDGAV
jgi:hypothetical protein